MKDCTRYVHVEEGEKCGVSESMLKVEIIGFMNASVIDKNLMILPKFFGVNKKKDGVALF